MPLSKPFLMLTVLLALSMLIVPVNAQTPGVPYAAITANELTLYDVSPAPIVVSSPAHRALSKPIWSPAGDKLAYILLNESSQPYLMVADAQGNVLVQGTEVLEFGFPVSFTPDGDVLYVVQGEAATSPLDYQVTLKRLPPVAGAAPEEIGRFQYGVGCGGGSPYPTDWQYADEGGGLNGNYGVLAWTAFGILHSTTCTGAGLALYNPDTGVDAHIGPTFNPQNGAADGQPLGRVKLSPDGQRLAATRIDYSSGQLHYQLVLVDLTTLTITEVATSENLDFVAWGTGNTLFYSTRTQNGDLVTSLTSDQMAALNQAVGYEMTTLPTYTSELWQLNLDSGQPAQLLYSAPVYAIVRMQLAPDGSALYFSNISNLDGWVAGLISGTINILEDVNGDQQRGSVPVTLYRLLLGTGEAPTLINTDARQFVLQP